MPTASDNIPAPPFLRAGVVLPFLLVSLIWGSTWWVITGQVAVVPPGWSVAYRFAIATPAMFAMALASRLDLRLGAQGHRLAFVVGVGMFCANYNFVYRAEEHLTSGIVAVMIALILVPNAVLGRLLLGHPITRRFAAGSAVATAGIALLLIHEAREGPGAGGNVALGIVFALLAMLFSALANVVQANDVGRRLPMLSLLAWALLYGTGCDVAVAWASAGPPVWPRSAAFWAGTAYLAIAGSVVTFPLYFRLTRQLGPGRAGYTNVAVVVIAMAISTGLEGYRWSALAIAGALLSTAGLAVALSARKPSA